MNEPADINATRQKSLDDEAAVWVARLDYDEPSEATLRDFKAWVRQSPSHRKAFEGYVEVWEQMNMLSQMVPPRKSESGLGWFAQPFAPLGLAFAVVLGVALLLQQFIAPTNMQYLTQVGEQKTFTLPDGSKALLNTNTEIQVRYTSERRVIYLSQGEAHFTVVKNTEAPFEVHAGQGLVRAVGTAFGVYLRADDVEVVVTEGLVELDTLPVVVSLQAEQPRLLSDAVPQDVTPNSLATASSLPQIAAGNLAIYGRHTAKHVLLAELEKMDEKISWHQGMLVFDNESLENVVAEIGRYTSTKILIPERNVRELKVGGHFKVGDTEAMFEALLISFNIRAERVAEGLVYLVKEGA